VKTAAGELSASCFDLLADLLYFAQVTQESQHLASLGSQQQGDRFKWSPPSNQDPQNELQNATTVLAYCTGSA
jgi:hypothetical protein